MSQFEYSSNSGLKTVIIVGVVALSVILFFAFTLPFFKNREVVETKAPPARETESPEAAAPSPPSPSPSPPVAAPAPAKPAAPAGKTYLKPQNLLSDLASHLASGNLPAALTLLRAGDIDEDHATRFEQLITEGHFKPAEKRPFAEIGRFNSEVRYSLHLHRLAGNGLEAADTKVIVDLSRGAPGTGWTVSSVRVPTFTAVSAAATALGGAPSPVVVKGDSARPNDPLMLAHEFVDAILARDFTKARSLVDTDKVSEEKLAGLFIVAEEGGFRRRDESPLVATAARDNAAWVIAQLVNPETSADFGLEFVRSPGPDGIWKIAGLNLDSLLLARSKMAGVDGVTYTPIIKNPSGGDSLVLFFAYDDAGLHPRSARQIEIVAEILRGDPKKTILINGHADAMGSDDYNAQLSNQRADGVKKGLLAAGVLPSQIVTRSFGESEPISPNVRPDGSDNPDGRKRNRRAEVYLNF